jgi:hypothetical protein
VVSNRAARAVGDTGAERVADALLPAAARKRLGTAAETGESAVTVRAPVPDAGSARAVAFNLLIVTFTPGVLFVSDIRQAPLTAALESGVLAFLRDVMSAIGRPPPSDAATVDYFQWPWVMKPGVDASEARAREVLDGLLGRKRRESSADLLVLMGRTARRCVNIDDGPDGQAAVQIVRSEALGRLFSTPGQKDELWRALYQATVARA